METAGVIAAQDQALAVPSPPQDLGTPSDQWQDWLVTTAIISAAAIFLALAFPMIQGRMYVLGDLANQHIPTRRFYADCLEQGDRPEWFPYIYRGYYLHGDGQVGMYHPLHWLIYRFCPFVQAIDVEILTSYLLMFAGCYLFARAKALPRIGALFGATLFTFCGFNLLHLAHLNMVAAVAHLPWLLLGIEYVLRDTQPRRVAWGAMILSFTVGSLILVGHPHAAWHCVLIALAYAIGQLMRAATFWRWLLLAGCFVMGLFIGIVQWWETWSALGETNRNRPSSEFLAFGSLHPANIIQYIAPYLFHFRVIDNEMKENGTHEFGLYAGAVVPVLLLWVILRWRRIKAYRGLRWGALTLVVAGYVLALGKYLPPLQSAMSQVPVVGLFRCPSRYCLLTYAGLTVLSTIGLVDLLSIAAKKQKIALWQMLALLAVPLVSLVTFLLVATFGVMTADKYDWQLSSAGLGLAGVALSLTATLLVIAAARGLTPALFGLVLFSALDLSIYGISHARRIPPMTYDELLAFAPVLAPDSMMRIEPIPTSDLATLLHQRIFSGFVSLLPTSPLTDDRNWYLKNIVLVMRLTSVQSVVNKGQEIQIPDPMSRVRLVTRTEQSTDVRARLPQIDITTTALVEEPVSLQADEPGRAAIESESPGRINVLTRSRGTQFLVVSEHYNPGWLALVNGEPTKVYRVYGELIGCVIPAGTNEVLFEFNPRSLAVTRRISLAAFILALALTGGGLLLSLRKKTA